MKKEERLFKNFGILTIGNASVKIISFLLIPLYTSILTAEELGIYELIITTVSLLMPIVTLDVADATLRFSLDDSVEKKEIYRVSMKYCLLGAFVVMTLLVVNRLSKVFSILIGREIIFFLVFINTALIAIFGGFAKGVGKVKEVAISGALGAFMTIIFSVLLLVPIKMRLQGYLLANAIGLSTQALYLYIVLIPDHKGRGTYNKELESGALNYSIPLIASNVAWWVNSALDRYIVTLFCGISENGIYSVGYKIPTIINMVQSLFHQAWTLSAIQEYDSVEANEYYKKMYRAYNLVLVIICGFIIAVCKPFSKVMYAKEFYKAWIYSPFLCIGFVFLGLSNYMGGIISATKKTGAIAYTTILGACLNCLLNILLIPYYGAIGAAFATCMSYMLIWMMRSFLVNKTIGISLFVKKDAISYVLLLIEAIFVMKTGSKNVMISIIAIIALLVIYNSELNVWLNKIFRFLRKDSM